MRISMLFETITAIIIQIIVVITIIQINNLKLISVKEWWRNEYIWLSIALIIMLLKWSYGAWIASYIKLDFNMVAYEFLTLLTAIALLIAYRLKLDHFRKSNEFLIHRSIDLPVTISQSDAKVIEESIKH